MKSRVRIFAIILAIVTFFPSYSQKGPIKFGKIESEEFKISDEEKESGFSAVVLADFGVTKFTYLDVGSTFQMTFDRITRIKIINKEGFDWANVSIPYYHDSNGKEQVLSLKGFTYNLNGTKIEKSKLTNSSIFTEEINDYWDQEKFSMPEVKEGSIIEYSYTVKSEFYSHLREWEFQWDIPVKWSEYIVTIPEYFNYQPLMQGYIPLTERTTDVENVNVNLTSVERTGGYSMSSNHVTDRVQYRDLKTRYVIKNVPPLKEEPFITTTENYRSKITHELNFIKFPNSPPYNFMDNWGGLNKSYLENEDFGQKLGRTAFAKEQLSPIRALGSEEEKLVAVYKLLVGKVKWDETYRKYSYESPRKIYEDGQGSSADINLMLTGFLREVGIEADPVIISTRSNGYVREQLAVSDQFNYVICRATVNGKHYLIDATDPHLPIGVLPLRCINGRGRIISEKSPGWADLTYTPGSEENSTIHIGLDESGSANVKVERKYKGYSAYGLVTDYTRRGHEEYVVKLKENHQNWDIKEVNVDDENPTDSVTETYTADLDQVATKAGPLLYINPILIERTEDNPFASDDRKYPVEFGYNWAEQITAVVSIPEGFVQEEVPENVSVAMEDQSVIFNYRVSKGDKTLTVVSEIKINRPVISADRYAELRELWSKIVAKHSEQIVLKASQ